MTVMGKDFQMGGCLLWYFDQTGERLFLVFGV